MSRAKKRKQSFLPVNVRWVAAGFVGIGLIWIVALSYPAITNFAIKYALPGILTGVRGDSSGRTEAANNLCSWILLSLPLLIPFYTTLQLSKILYPEIEIGAVISRGIYASFASGEISWEQARLVSAAAVLAIVHFIFLAVAIDYFY